MEEVKLTQFSRSSGCGCKIDPAKLEAILKKENPAPVFKNLLVGNESRDDAAVLDMGNGMALISTTDFFTPVVNDAYDFGRIAAANAISDVYAMGGKPSMAIAVLGWPVETLSSEIAAKVMEGGRAICAEAGIPLAGGHSIDSKEPFFGLAVNGFIETENIKTNRDAKEGDLLFLTKPLGTGILATALKRGILKEEHYPKLISTMSKLNKAGESFGKLAGVHAMTDITGFGFYGHLIEMAEGSNLSVEINAASVPLISGIEFYTSQFCFPDNTYRNWNSYQSKVNKEGERFFIPFADPQTNGGLLIAVSPGSVNSYRTAALDAGLDDIAMNPIGTMVAKQKEVVQIL